jgi:hypothetical protein
LMGYVATLVASAIRPLRALGAHSAVYTAPRPL